jgi:predicted AAA+ superfamily ATPase
MVFQHLRAWIDYRQSDMRIYFWRTRAGNEVDFILYGSEGFYAIEVKNGRIIRKPDLRELKTFGTDYPECKTVLLYRGEETIENEGVLCYPVDKFLCNLHPSEALLGRAV